MGLPSSLGCTTGTSRRAFNDEAVALQPLGQLAGAVGLAQRVGRNDVHADRSEKRLSGDGRRSSVASDLQLDVIRWPLIVSIWRNFVPRASGPSPIPS